jgi:hypothetical protein
MAIDIPSLFRDVIETPEQRQRRKLSEAVALAPQARGGIASLLNPLAQAASINLQQGSEGLGRSVGGMLGLDMRDTSQKVSDELLGADLSSPQGMRDLSKAISAYAPVQAIGLLERATEQERIIQDREIAEQERQRIGGLEQRADERADIQLSLNAGRLDAELKRLDQSLDNTLFIQDLQTKNYELSNKRYLLAKESQENSEQRLLAGDREAQKDYLTQYESDERLIYKANNLADTFASEEFKSRSNAGAAGAAKRAITRLLDGGDETLLTYTELTELRNQAAMGNLPKGAASDKDVALVLAGTINEYSKPDEIERYLRGISKLAAINAEKQFQKIDYLSKAGGNFAGYLEEMNKFEQSEQNDLYNFKEGQNYQSYMEEKFKIKWDIPKTEELLKDENEDTESLLDEIYNR